MLSGYAVPRRAVSNKCKVAKRELQKTCFRLILLKKVNKRVNALSVIIILNFHYFTSGFKKLVKLSPNMDSLVAIGSSTSYLYGIYNFIRMIIALISQDETMAMHYSHNLYFESAAMILTLVSVGKYLVE